MRRKIGWQEDVKGKVVVAKKGDAFSNTCLNTASKVVKINL
jgi:hypothetical protein